MFNKLIPQASFLTGRPDNFAVQHHKSEKSRSGYSQGIYVTCGVVLPEFIIVKSAVVLSIFTYLHS
jgi:hypothetical protein